MKKIGRLIQYYIFNESVKQMEVKRIMDKISKKKPLTKKEKNFLDLYQTTSKEDLKDFLYLSKNTAFTKILELLEKKITDKEVSTMKIDDLIKNIKIFNQNSCPAL